jgi:type III secretion protein J
MSPLPRPRFIGRDAVRRIATVACILPLLAACRTDLYVDVDQRQANEMIAVLLQHGIPAERVFGKNGRITVSVDDGRFAEAVRILNDNGLPKQDFVTLGKVFEKNNGIVPSPVQQRTQLMFALSQELSRTVSEIDGVLSARVHLVLPENDPLRQQLIPSSASVFIRHHAQLRVNELVPQVKMLVANGIAGLSYDKVSVVTVLVEKTEAPAGNGAELVSLHGLWMHRDSVRHAAWLLYGLVAAVIALAGAVGALMLRQRQRIYPLQRAATAKPL